MANVSDNWQPKNSPGAGAVTMKRGTLAAIVGAAAAAILIPLVAKEESGRTVTATIAPDGTATVTHISGRQYLSAYLDIVGVPTACDGITRGVRMGQSYTEEQCNAMGERELLEHAQGAVACTPRLATAPVGVRVAAVSLVYNIGVAGWCGSTAGRRVQSGNWRGACEAMTWWNKAGGRTVSGLRARREREYAICIRGL